jgi:hypothetical protein
MKRMIVVMAVVGVLVGAGFGTMSWSAELTTIQTQKTKDAVITLKSETGQWKAGKNTFVLEFTSPSGQPLDAGKVALSTSMGMPGMAPMVTGATVSPDKAPGRYVGTIDFPDRGTRQVTVTWDGPAGKGSATFSVPVR